MLSKEISEKVSRIGRQVSDATIFMHEAIAKNAGLTGIDHKYLGIILDKGPLTAGELSKLTGLTTGAITGLIDRLEKKKLVKRQFDKTDRRKILIAPNTEKINTFFTRVHLDLKTQIEQLLAKFSKKEIDAIEKYLIATTAIMTTITKKLNEK